MGWSDDDVQESRERLQRQIAKRRAQGEAMVPMEAPKGSKKLSATFWGQAWCRHLEAYQQYEARLPAGRSYLRQGKVHDLTIKPGSVSAVVAGSELYDTTVAIRPLGRDRWEEIAAECAGQTPSMLDLLAGRLGDSMLRILTDAERGLFPRPGEIRFDCSCPDYANLCKHAAAVLYGVGVLLDSTPELLFTLRGVDPADLLGSASRNAAAGLAELDTDMDLGNADLSALFGIDLGDGSAAAEMP